MAQADEVTTLTGATDESPSPGVRSRNRATATVLEAPSPRRRGSRGGRRHHKAAAKQAPTPIAVVKEAPPPEPAPKPKRARGSRGGVGRKRKPKVEAKAPVAEATVAAPAPAKPKPARRRARKPEHPAAYDDVKARAKPTVAPPRARVPVTGEPKDVPPPFAHNAEYEFARILDFYGIAWEYEPRSFPLRWERGHVTEAFTPDFYLPDLDLYVELTTLKPGLTAEKNRKMRQIKDLFPDTNIIMLKKRDYLRLLAKYGYGAIAPGQMPDIDKVLIPANKLSQRVQEIGQQISEDYAGKEPVLVGVLRGVLVFIADLMRQISVPTSIDMMAVSSYEGTGQAPVRILKDLDLPIKGRDVILVEDIVDTGMTLNTLIDYLQTKKPASLKVAALLDKRARRLVNVPVDYVGFEIPDEFVVGYGLDFNQRFRNLPFIATLKHELLP
ncbi:MAG TPA: hypoxanthine phosphoribosyltransferase [Dehalococcoidia bacterium]|jgi:hypoxanthine phosphoribosyltransferase|nr:hypoxanthine phosphoribosyltransferase [Dehalococcoidia bacterium]